MAFASAAERLDRLLARRSWGRRLLEITVDGEVATRDRLLSHLQPAQESQLVAVLSAIESAELKQRLRLSLEAMLSRYIPATPIASNVELFDSVAFWKRQPMLQEAQLKAAAFFRMPPAPPPKAMPLPDALVARVRAARRCTWIVGAGLSTAAGIPTYRGPGGVYEDKAYERMLMLPFYLSNPDLVWAHVNGLKLAMKEKAPTPAHRAIAALGARKESNTVITQNVDGFERQLGLETIPLHGQADTYRCLKEGREKLARDPRYNDESFPICPDCGALLKPGVVFFFEGLDAKLFDRALDAIASSDLVLEVGTSHVVYPVSEFWKYAKKKGATLVVVNVRPQENASQADFFIEADCQDVLTSLQQQV